MKYKEQVLVVYLLQAKAQAKVATVLFSLAR